MKYRPTIKSTYNTMFKSNLPTTSFTVLIYIIWYEIFVLPRETVS